MKGGKTGPGRRMVRVKDDESLAPDVGSGNRQKRLIETYSFEHVI